MLNTALHLSNSYGPVHIILVLIGSRQKPFLNAYADVRSGARSKFWFIYSLYMQAAQACRRLGCSPM